MNPYLSIVLVDPENPDNIGAVARAMKNMGLRDLRLVRPPKGWKRKGKKMAMSARDVLYSAQCYDELPDAVADTYLVIATSRREGPKRGKFISYKEAIRKIKLRTRGGRKVSLLFGKESKGLDNDSLAHADWTTTIPASAEYPSINLSQAVMIFAFSLFETENRTSETQSVKSELRYVTKETIYEVLARIRPALEALNYREEGYDVIARILATFHGLFKRSGLIESEAQMLRGLGRRISEKMQAINNNGQ